MGQRACSLLISTDEGFIHMSSHINQRTQRSFMTRVLGVGIAVAVAAAGVSGGGGEEAEAQKVPPNILFVLTDDQRWDTMWAMPSVRHRIGQKGVVFDNGFVVNSLCCPSRASILTGLYSHSTGVWTNRPPTGGFDAFNDESTLPVWLDEAGYRTAFIGKYLNNYNRSDSAYVPPGWDKWVAYAGSRRKSIYYDYWLSVNGSKKKRGTEPSDYSTDVYANYAARFIRRSEDPFFLLLAPSAPHKPARPAARHEDAVRKLPRHRPPSFDETDVSDKPEWLQNVAPLSIEKRKALKRTQRNQYRSLLAVDEAVDRLLDVLEEQNELGRTMVIFTSDNGLLWGEHRWKLKEVAYEEAIRVPLMVRAPDVLLEGSSSDAFALNIDLAPTIADYAAAAIPETEGTSLRPVILNPDDDLRSSFLIEHLQEPGHEKPPTYCAIRNRNFSYTAYQTGEEELYDMQADPYQLENVAGRSGYRQTLLNMRVAMAQRCSPPPPGFDPGLFD
jgi:N-acetylglucosamine-6-sulfatase